MHQLRLITPQSLSRRLFGARVLLASVPKAGTNLASRLLMLLHFHYAGNAVGPKSEWPKMLKEIEQVRKGQFVVTHFHWLPELDVIFENADIRGVYVSRDPRDVCVSQFHWIMRYPQHAWHEYYNRTLPDDFSRLMASITGIEIEDADGSVARLYCVDNIYRSRFRLMTHPRFCHVTFEDLVGPNGGGNVERQKVAISRVVQHMGLHVTRRQLDAMAGKVFSENSPTFRRGQSGSWKQEMTEKHKKIFKEVAGQLLIDLGYETGFDW